MQRFRLLVFAFLFLWRYDLRGETCRLIVMAEEDGLNGKQGNPPGAAILFGPPVDVPSFRLLFSEKDSGKAVKPLFWFSVKKRAKSGRKGEIPPYGRGFSRHRDLSVRWFVWAAQTTHRPVVSNHRFDESVRLSLG